MVKRRSSRRRDGGKEGARVRKSVTTGSIVAGTKVSAPESILSPSRRESERELGKSEEQRDDSSGGGAVV